MLPFSAHYRDPYFFVSLDGEQQELTLSFFPKALTLLHFFLHVSMVAFTLKL